MASSYKPELSTVEEVLAFYERSEGSEYKVYGATSVKDEYCRFHFTGEKELGLEELREGLMQIQRNTDNTNPYLIQVLGKNVKGKPKMMCITFQLNKAQSLYPANTIGSERSAARTEVLLERILENQNQLVSRISALEVEEEEDTPEEQGLAGLGSILNNPQVQTLLIGALGKLFTGNAPMGANIAGIPSNINELSEVHLIVDQLMNKGVTLDHLRKLNDMGEMKLKSLLLML